MTESNRTEDSRPVCEIPKTKAAAAPCKECPWRASNARREHSAGQYSDENLTRTWREVAKDGRFLGCHLFDSDYHLIREQDLLDGYQKPTDIGSRRECAGGVAVLQREFEIMLTYPSHAEYLAARPIGLSRKAVLNLRERLAGRLEPEIRFKPNPDYTDIVDPADRIDTTSMEWKWSAGAAVSMLTTLDALVGNTCNCQLCEKHEEAHPSKTLRTITGDDVQVDQELHGLLDTLVKAGIRTVSSCVNFSDALDKLWPEQKAQLVRNPLGDLHYRDIILLEAAHIRIRNTTPQAKAFIEAALQTPDVGVETAGIVTQVVFPLAAIPHLTKIADIIRTVDAVQPVKR